MKQRAVRYRHRINLLSHTGEGKDRTADTVLVPPGASWDTEGTASFDPAGIQRHGEAYSPDLKKK